MNFHVNWKRGFLSRFVLLFIICIQLPGFSFGQPANDNCSGAISLTVNSPLVSGTTLGATLQTGESIGCASAGTNQSVWYSFAATAANLAVIITQTAGSCNPKIGSTVWTSSGTCPTLGGCNPISCQAADNGPTATVHSLSNLTIGETYYVQVLYTTSAVCGASADFTIGVSTTIPANPSNPPPVSTCQNPSGPACVFNYNPTVAQVTATCPSYTNPPAADGINEVLHGCFTFTAQNSSTITFQNIINSTCGASNVIWFEWQLFNNTCNSIACGSNINTLNATGLICGNSYTICYTYEIPNCTHTFFYPYIVAIPPVLTVTANGTPISTTICAGSAATLNASATGYTNYTWSPATGLSATTGATVTATPAVTTTYTVTGFDAGGCSQSIPIVVNVNPLVTPTFAAVGPLCQNSTAPVLPLTSTNGITGTWSPATVNTTTAGTTVYTFTPTAGMCATSTTLSIAVDPQITPTFTAIGPLCQNSAAPTLPLTSTNGITGTWSPVTINTATAGTTVYTFTPTTGMCATSTTLSIAVNPQITPTFTAIGPLCQNSAAPVLPLTSTNGITGTWSPATVNTTTAGTTVYTFTPTAGMCATSTTLSIAVDPQITPTFTAIGPLCQNSAAPTLPLTSTNGITGIWSPATINTATAGTTIYTFTPTVGLCATTTTLSITVDPQITPTFTTIGPLCQNSTPPLLPLTSTNGITGTWSPATVNTATAGTTIYTFTPTAGLCATSTTLSITIDPQITPTFTAIGPLCQNSTPPVLSLSSTNGITGTWNPATINTTTVSTTTYIFTPNAGQCAITATLDIVVTSQITPTFITIGPLCQNSTPPVLPLTSTNGITGTWNPATVNTATAGTTVYTFTPTAGTCATTTTLSITIDPQTTPTFAAIGPLCQNSTAPVLPLTSTNGITGTWNPATINTATAGTTVFTFIPTAGSCATTATLNITVDPQITPTFTTIGPLCQNSTPPVLPLTSINGITGTWSPATISTATAGITVYTFTPTAGLCATTTTLSITIDPQVTPTFTTIGPLCQNSTPPLLPLTSTNSITGIWSPATINTATAGTTVFTFTPTAGLCATSTTLSITVNPQITPMFAAIGPLCQNSIPPVLPLTSTNGITGTWSPATVNTTTVGTTTHTFTPNTGQCATTTTLDIVVTTQVTPLFAAISPLCQNSTPPVLSLTSTNGITGTWSPATINTATAGTTVFTFTPTAALCATTATLSVTVNQTFTSSQVVSICQGQSYVLPWGILVSTPGIYRDTLRYTTGCDSLRRIVNVQVTAAANYAINPSICAGETYTLPWGTVVNSAGIYQDTVRTSQGCDSLVRIINLKVNARPSITISKSNDINCSIGISRLNAGGGSQYQWSPAGTLNNPSVSNPVASPAANTTYHVTVTSVDGCVSEDSITVIVNTDGLENGFKLPNAFTPYRDGKNDCFGVNKWGLVSELRFSIYNRWGQRVFFTTDPSKCWDGTFRGAELPSAGYVYQVNAKTHCGYVYRQGTVVLIR